MLFISTAFNTHMRGSGWGLCLMQEKAHHRSGCREASPQRGLYNSKRTQMRVWGGRKRQVFVVPGKEGNAQIQILIPLMDVVGCH